MLGGVQSRTHPAGLVDCLSVHVSQPGVSPLTWRKSSALWGRWAGRHPVLRPVTGCARPRRRRALGLPCDLAGLVSKATSVVAAVNVFRLGSKLSTGHAGAAAQLSGKSSMTPT